MAAMTGGGGGGGRSKGVPVNGRVKSRGFATSSQRTLKGRGSCGARVDDRESFAIELAKDDSRVERAYQVIASRGRRWSRSWWVMIMETVAAGAREEVTMQADSGVVPLPLHTLSLRPVIFGCL